MTGRKDFTDHEMPDAKIASALKRLLEKRVGTEEQRAQQYDRFLRGRLIAHMIYEDLRAMGAWEAVLGLSDQFSFRLHDNDVQDFDTRWDQALSAASEIPTDTVLEGLCKSKLQVSVRRQTVLALYEQENARNNEPPSNSRLKTKVRRHID